MKYVSTRGSAPIADFETVLTAGLAPDGGLYVPEEFPTAERLRASNYAEAAAEVLAHFTGDAFTREKLREMTEAAYSGFDDADTAPLTQVGDEDWILELYHGPTLAFKDFAMQLLGRLFDDVLERRGERLTVIAATSGDTGAAAIHALAPCRNAGVVVLHPEGRVTDVQRRMMTSVDAPNVLNIAVEGDFDQCQAIVKNLFADRTFADRVKLSGVNSINWARLAAQTVYYFTAAAAIGADGPVNFVVPTGNFGDVYAGFVAKQMGLNVGRLGVATNANSILHKALSTGSYRPEGVHKTLSPSMDIQVASNFERLLYNAYNRDGAAINDLMKQFAEDRDMKIPSDILSAISQDFVSHSVSDDETLAEISAHHDRAGVLIDPHTAVGRVAAKALREAATLTGPIVTLSTAHPAKFPDAVSKATGKTPALTPAWADLSNRSEHIERAPAEAAAIADVIAARFG